MKEFESHDSMAVVSDDPNIQELTSELTRSAVDNGIAAKMANIDAIRYCTWNGQTSDGKKHTEKLGKDAFPWDGASDTCVFIADEAVNSEVDLMVTSFWRSSLKVSPNKTSSSADAAASHALMDWVLKSKLNSELVRDVELVAQNTKTYGWCGVHITWQQEMGQREVEITIEKLRAIASQSNPGSIWDELPSLVMNESSEDQVAELLIGAFPNLKKKEALMCVRELRDNGKCDVPIPVMVKNQPCVAALSPFDELCFPPETTDIQSARVVFRRCYMTEIEIRQKVLNGEWDEEWANLAISNRGNFSGFTEAILTSTGAVNGYEDRSELCEIVYAYRKAIDDRGNPGLWCTVFSPSVNEKWGAHELIDYSHGMYPFVVWRSEIPHRKITESRGIPEIVRTWQNEIKAQRDSIFDYTSISTIPPIQVPKTRGGRLEIGPAKQLPVMRVGEIAWMNPPAREPAVAFNLIKEIQSQVDKYLGRPTENTPPAISQMRQQRTVNTFLHGWTEVFRQVLSLSVQYLEPEEVARITGIDTSVTQSDQDFDISLRFDVRELQTDLLTDKLKAFVEIVGPSDRAGRLNWGKITPALARLIDPSMADEFVIDESSATQAMMDETNNEIALIALGNPPKLRENDPTASARLKFAAEIIQKNPRYQQLAQTDELFASGLEKYIKNLFFSVQQQNNAQTGKLGVQE